jgi:hypothetical protein
MTFENDGFTQSFQRESRQSDYVIATAWIHGFDRLDERMRAEADLELDEFCGAAADTRGLCREIRAGNVVRPFTPTQITLLGDIWRHLGEDHFLQPIIDEIMAEPAQVAAADQVKRATETLISRFRPKGKG